jgi:hypothetical protein
MKRRPQGVRTRKISISVSEDDLRVLTARAVRLYGGNISAVVHDLARAARQAEALDTLLEALGGEPVTEAQMRAIRAEWTKPRRRTKAA